MTREQRRAPENGIWMCRTHGELIDDDEVRFAVTLLKQWRKRAERRAAIVQAKNSVDLNSFDLFDHQIEIEKGRLSEAIVGEGFVDAGVTEFWRDSAGGALRDFVFEVAKNAFDHGGAHLVRILFGAGGIEVVDDGGAFDPRDLATSPGRGVGRRHSQFCTTRLETG